MGQSAEELRREIEQTRGNLSGTVDAIGDRVSPGRIVERKTNKAREGLRSVKETLMGSASSAGTAVSDATASMAGTAGQATDRLREAPSSLKDAATTKAQGAPLATGLVAFGAGVLAAALFKGSETEGRVAQAAMGAAQPIKEAATEVGQQLAAGLKDQGQQAVEQVKETAVQATQEVKDQAQQATQQTVETGKDATQQVKDQAQQATQTVTEQASSSAETVRQQP